MNARYQNGVVTAHCLGSGALATFEKPRHYGEPDQVVIACEPDDGVIA